MATRQFLLLIIPFLIASCTNVEKRTPKINLSSSGDTLSIVKFYPTDSVKEIIYYRDNRPVTNIGFHSDGDTMKFPYVVLTKQDSSLFVFIPRALHICSWELLFGLDSAFIANTDQASLDRFQQLSDSLHYTSHHFNTSTDLKLDRLITTYGVSKGVLKCKMDSGCNVFRYYPFDLNRKHYH